MTETSDHKGQSLCVVTPYPPTVTETFIRSHVADLFPKTVVVHGWRPTIGDRVVIPFSQRVLHKIWRLVANADLDKERTPTYLKIFREHNVFAVLAEYGGCGVWAANACSVSGIPLIVHFHGHDASDREVLDTFKDGYLVMFKLADALIAVSNAMKKQLISLGAPPEKIHYNPYGVDCERFFGAKPATAPPVFIAVGRFTPKKSPQSTIKAFAQVALEVSDARLVMIGDGPLLEESRVLASDLGIASAVRFLGSQEHSIIEAEMRKARCFVQHSVVAPSGDSEGTPVAIIEAGATGLPVVSTRHAGIPDVVVEGKTGFLTDEGDVQGMTDHMLRLARDPQLAGVMGSQAQEHIRSNFSKEGSLGRLREIIQSCIAAKQI